MNTPKRYREQKIDNSRVSTRITTPDNSMQVKVVSLEDFAKLEYEGVEKDYCTIIDDVLRLSPKAKYDYVLIHYAPTILPPQPEAVKDYIKANKPQPQKSFTWTDELVLQFHRFLKKPENNDTTYEELFKIFKQSKSSPQPPQEKVYSQDQYNKAIAEAIKKEREVDGWKLRYTEEEMNAAITEWATKGFNAAREEIENPSKHSPLLPFTIKKYFNIEDYLNHLSSNTKK
jgi:hypothetical protein